MLISNVYRSSFLASSPHHQNFFSASGHLLICSHRRSLPYCNDFWLKTHSSPFAFLFCLSVFRLQKASVIISIFSTRCSCLCFRLLTTSSVGFETTQLLFSVGCHSLGAECLNLFYVHVPTKEEQ